MAQVMGELLARFESAHAKLAATLEQSEGDASGSIIAGDRQLADVFGQILEARLPNDDDRTVRIEFLLKEIMAASDRDGLVCTLAEKAMGDVNEAMTSRQSPPVVEDKANTG